jgi:hypothetical protein
MLFSPLQSTARRKHKCIACVRMELCFSLCCVCELGEIMCRLSLTISAVCVRWYSDRVVSQSLASLSPAHVRTLFVQQYQQPMCITGIYTPAYPVHLLYYGFQFIVICTTYLCCMEMRVCKLPPGQIEAVYSKAMCSFLHDIVKVDVDHIMPV